MSSRRRQRRSISTTEDRISALPDSLICHVLSFLPTKLAVATTILSKRWNPLWLSVPTLHFDDELFQDFASFRYFVYYVLLSRDAKIPLPSFSIRFGKSNNFDPHDLNLFVLAALQRRIEIFSLDMSHIELHFIKETVPSILRILSCKTLVVLKLRNFAIYEVPRLIHLPLLKTLHLDFISFLSDFVHFMNLVRGCPILEDLETNFVNIPNLDHGLEGEFKGFPKLMRANLYHLEENIPLAWLHNAKFLRAELMCSGYDDIQIPTFHNLTHMELRFCYDSWSTPHGKWKWTNQMLQHCPKLQNLIIDEDFNDIDSTFEDEDWMDPKTIPECLSSHLRTCSLRGYKGSQSQLQFAEYIMLNSKLLCTMTIKSNCTLDRNAKQMLVKLSSYPTVTCKLLFK